MLASLLVSIHNGFLSQSRSDRRHWSKSNHSSCVFSCKSFFSTLVEDLSVPDFLPAGLIWKSNALLKVKVLAWPVAHQRMNTNELNQKKRMRLSVTYPNKRGCVCPLNGVFFASNVLRQRIKCFFIVTCPLAYGSVFLTRLVCLG